MGKNEYFYNTKITIIDDSRAFCLGIQALLAHEKCVITTFLNPHDAIENIKINIPDIIITDLEMPHMNGLEIIKAIKKIESISAVPILLLTSKDDAETLVNSIEVGADAFVSKNSVQGVLKAQLLSLIRLGKLRKDLLKVHQFEAVRSLIGTYKHELGNTLAILDGKINKLQRVMPDVANVESFLSIKNTVVRFTATLEKLDKLREYEEEKYSSQSNILKI